MHICYFDANRDFFGYNAHADYDHNYFDIHLDYNFHNLVVDADSYFDIQIDMQVDVLDILAEDNLAGDILAESLADNLIVGMYFDIEVVVVVDKPFDLHFVEFHKHHDCIEDIDNYLLDFAVADIIDINIAVAVLIMLVALLLIFTDKNVILFDKWVLRSNTQLLNL